MYLFGVASLERFKTKYGVALLHSQNSNMFLLCYSLCGKYFLGCPFIYMWPSFFLVWFVKNTLTCTFGYHHVCPSVFLMITQSQHSAETLVPAKDQLCLSEPLMLYIFFLQVGLKIVKFLSISDHFTHFKKKSPVAQEIFVLCIQPTPP